MQTSFRLTDAHDLQPLGAPQFPAPSAADKGTQNPPSRPSAKPITRFWYLPVRAKFVLALVTGAAWFGGSWWLALPWIHDLSAIMGPLMTYFAVGGIALVPGFMNAFLATSLMLDRRPARRAPDRYPGLSILIAAHNHSSSIEETLKSIANSGYPGDLEVIVIDDGSADGTAEIAARQPYPWARVLRQPRNLGKSAALNRGLAEARHGLIVTLHGDSFLYRDALQRLVERYLSDPADTRAVAGTMLVGSSRRNWVTRAQEWDYFHGIAAVKRVQSLYQGTLVAQGAFSIYDRQVLLDLGGWEECVGEDIVLTWALLKAGWRVGYAEDACCFTKVPESLGQFIRQRERSARGVVEAFRRHPGILFARRMSTLFVWWNLLFPWLDLAYTVFFLPGVILALLGIFWFAGPMTLVLLPMALVMNFLMFHIQVGMFARQGLRVRRNTSGFLIYAFAYSVILQPACVWGYLAGALGVRKP